MYTYGHTLSLHAALPIFLARGAVALRQLPAALARRAVDRLDLDLAARCRRDRHRRLGRLGVVAVAPQPMVSPGSDRASTRLNSSPNAHLVCRLLLDKNTIHTPHHRCLYVHDTAEH